MAVLSLVLVGCGGGGSDSGAEADSSGGDGASSDFCTSVRELIDELDGLDEEYSGDDFYGDVGDVYDTLRSAAPEDLADDFDRVIDGFEKIRAWSEDPSSEYPFTDDEDAELEASMNRIDTAVSQDCGIDTGPTEEGGPPDDPAIGLDLVDDAATGDELTIDLDSDDGSGEASLGGDLPDDFPFPLPDVYEVGSSFEFDDSSGTTYSAVLHAPEDAFDAIVTLYEDFLNDDGFEVTTSDFSSGGGRFVVMTGDRSDAQAGITMSTEEVANDAAGNLVFETSVSLTWTPSG